MEIVIRRPRPDEFESWFALYEPYSHSVESAVDLNIARIVWEWIVSKRHGVEALVAERDGTLVGLAHYRPFPRTLNGNEAGYLDDIYVVASERGSGVAKAIMDEVVRIARLRGWSHIRWVTTKGNVRARGFYDKMGEDMRLMTYRIPLLQD
ncbi:MAG: GNAT family N-acetyltransferase [Candidatus Eremiobacteraeota bacterium]|nr:GNAT family N-acetyltransferase [Candidatus Eremiobacteraeota bacterium]